MNYTNEGRLKECNVFENTNENQGKGNQALTGHSSSLQTINT